MIGGYTQNVGSPKSFSALLVGVFEGDKFIYTGKIGTGFKDLQQREMLKQFKQYETSKPAFFTTPDYNKPTRFNPRPAKADVTWLKPVLICEVSFTEMTSDGVMRHPSFEGMRSDKSPKEVRKETAKHTEELVAPKEKKRSVVKPHTNEIVRPYSTRKTKHKSARSKDMKSNSPTRTKFTGQLRKQSARRKPSRRATCSTTITRWLRTFFRTCWIVRYR
ncbi:MAG: hypothetical protein WDO15_25720 [Bacteroidota bacterium]